MLLEEINNIKESKKDLKKFGLTIGIVLLILSTFLFYKEKKSAIYFGDIGVVFLVLALLAPMILKPLNKIWMSFSIILGWIMTRVILTVLFYLAITPIGLLIKLFRKDFLELKIDKSKSTYWQKREKKKFNPIDFDRQF